MSSSVNSTKHFHIENKCCYFSKLNNESFAYSISIIDWFLVVNENEKGKSWLKIL